MKTPDFTPAQIIALVGAIIGVAASFGFNLSQHQQDQIIGLITILAPILVGGDAVIRHGRSRVLINPPKPPDAVDGSGKLSA